MLSCDIALEGPLNVHVGLSVVGTVVPLEISVQLRNLRGQMLFSLNESSDIVLGWSFMDLPEFDVSAETRIGGQHIALLDRLVCRAVPFAIRKKFCLPLHKQKNIWVEPTVVRLGWLYKQSQLGSSGLWAWLFRRWPDLAWRDVLCELKSMHLAYYNREAAPRPASLIRCCDIVDIREARNCTQPYAFEVCLLSGAVYRFAASSLLEKAVWVDAIGRAAANSRGDGTCEQQGSSAVTPPRVWRTYSYLPELHANTSEYADFQSDPFGPKNTPAELRKELEKCSKREVELMGHIRSIEENMSQVLSERGLNQRPPVQLAHKKAELMSVQNEKLELEKHLQALDTLQHSSQYATAGGSS